MNLHAAMDTSLLQIIVNIIILVHFRLPAFRRLIMPDELQRIVQRLNR